MYSDKKKINIYKKVYVYLYNINTKEKNKIAKGLNNGTYRREGFWEPGGILLKYLNGEWH